jgi:hypothetical protein
MAVIWGVEGKSILTRKPLPEEEFDTRLDFIGIR